MVIESKGRVGGRPAVAELQLQQWEVIKRLRQGFKDEQEVTDWIFEVYQVTLGFLDEGTKRLLQNRIFHNLLVMSDKPWYQGFIEQVAKRLAAAMDAAMKEIAIRSGEERDSKGIPQKEIGGDSFGI